MCIIEDSYDCSYPNLNECIGVNLPLILNELQSLRHRKMVRHSKTSLKWRNQAFYYKKVIKKLSYYIEYMGLEVPDVKLLDAVFKKVKIPKGRTKHKGRRDDH